MKHDIQLRAVTDVKSRQNFTVEVLNTVTMIFSVSHVIYSVYKSSAYNSNL